MKTIVRAAGVCVLIIVAGCTTSTQYDTMQTALEGSPALGAKLAKDCEAKQSSLSSTYRQQAALLMNVSVAAMPRLLCQRVLRAIASKRMSYADFSAAERGVITPSFIRIIQGRS